MLHILWTPSVARPWWPTHQRFPKFPATVLTDCCCCRMRRQDTIARLVTSWDPPLGGMGCYQEPRNPWDRPRGRKPKQAKWADPDIPTGAWFEPRVDIECAPDKGCKKNPRRKFGMALREMWRM